MDNSDEEIGFRRNVAPRKNSETPENAKEVELQSGMGRSMTRDPQHRGDQFISRGPAPQLEQPPIVPEQREAPKFVRSQTTNQEGAIVSMDDEIKKEMPASVKTRLLFIEIIFFLNLLFLLIYFPVTM